MNFSVMEYKISIFNLSKYLLKEDTRKNCQNWTGRCEKEQNRISGSEKCVIMKLETIE